MKKYKCKQSCWNYKVGEIYEFQTDSFGNFHEKEKPFEMDDPYSIVTQIPKDTFQLVFTPCE